jgi:hypothetical protein
LTNNLVQWYEDDGTPRPSSTGSGCTRRDCAFAHPSDPDWKRAVSSHPPPGYEPRAIERERDQPVRLRRAAGYPTNEVTTGLKDKPGMTSLRKASVDSANSRTESRDKLPSTDPRKSFSDPRDRSRIVGIGESSTRTNIEKREESRSERRSSTADSGQGEKDERKSDGRKNSVSSVGRVPITKPETMLPPATKPPARTDAVMKEDLVSKADRIDAWVSRIKCVTFVIACCPFSLLHITDSPIIVLIEKWQVAYLPGFNI